MRGTLDLTDSCSQFPIDDGYTTASFIETDWRIDLFVASDGLVLEPGQTHGGVEARVDVTDRAAERIWQTPEDTPCVADIDDIAEYPSSSAKAIYLSGTVECAEPLADPFDFGGEGEPVTMEGAATFRFEAH